MSNRRGLVGAFLLLAIGILISSGSLEKTIQEQSVLADSEAAGLPPAVAWQRAFGQGDSNNSVFYTRANSLIQTNDAGYAFAGCYNSSIFMGKLDASGNMEWNRTYGIGSAAAVVQSDDLGFVLACDVSLSIMLLKTDSNGSPLWNQTFEDPSTPQSDWVPTSMAKARDGGYAIAGYAPNEKSLFQNEDFLLIKADSRGKFEWSAHFGGVGNEEAKSIIQTSDGGFALAGYTGSFGPYNTNFWLVKTDSDGSLQWARAYGREGLGHKIRDEYSGGSSTGMFTNTGYDVIQTSDYGYAIVGFAGSYGAWLVKTDLNGTAQWNQSYGSGPPANPYSVVQTGDGGYAIARQRIVTKADASGQVQWNQTYNNIDLTNPNQLPTGIEFSTILQTQDGGLALLGTANKDYAGMLPSPSFYLAKTAPFLPPQTAPPLAAPVSTVQTHLAFPTITIGTDGSVSPSTSPIRRNGNIYAFTSNFSGTLIVTKNDIVVEGAGFTLLGNGSITESDGSSTFIQFTEAGIRFSNAVDVEVRNLKLMNFKIDILFDGSCMHNSVHGNVFLGDIGTGILVRNELQDSRIADNNFVALEHAITIRNSWNNIISENVLTRFLEGGISLGPGANNTISHNFIFQGSGDGISGSSTGNRIVNNTITGTTTAIIAKNSVIAHNNITNNGHGIDTAESCIIFENILEENDIGLDGTGTLNNSIYSNNFINNKILQAGRLEYRGRRVPLQANTWTNWYDWRQGNYWSDYNGTDADGDGIGDTFYIIDGNNKDRNPLMSPMEISILEPPSPFPINASLTENPQPTSSTSKAPTGSTLYPTPPVSVPTQETHPKFTIDLLWVILPIVLVSAFLILVIAKLRTMRAKRADRKSQPNIEFFSSGSQVPSRANSLIALCSAIDLFYLDPGHGWIQEIRPLEEEMLVDAFVYKTPHKLFCRAFDFKG